MIVRHSRLFECLNKNGVEYLLIGGTLAIAYGVPRVTKDVDLFLNPTADNARRCLQALEEFGMGTAALATAEEICATEITIFKDVVRLDVLTSVKGLDFPAAWGNRVFLELEGVRIPALSLDDLIASKRAAARPGDLEDVEILEKNRNSSGGEIIPL